MHYGGCMAKGIGEGLERQVDVRAVKGMECRYLWLQAVFD